MAILGQVRDAMQFVNEQDAATRRRFIERLEFRATDPTFTAYRDAYLELIDLPRARAVLDLGCGTGVVGRAIAVRDGFAGTVTGVDQSPDFIAAARQFAADEGVGEHLEYLVGDAHELDMPTGSFDAVVAHTLVSHVRDPLAVLTQVGVARGDRPPRLPARPAAGSRHDPSFRSLVIHAIGMQAHGGLMLDCFGDGELAPP